jgi:hypothetical protein
MAALALQGSASPRLSTKGNPVKISLLIPVALAFGLAAVLAPAPADAACWGRGCYNHHWSGHRHWGGYYGQDYRQWREYGGVRGEW